MLAGAFSRLPRFDSVNDTEGKHGDTYNNAHDNAPWMLLNVLFFIGFRWLAGRTHELGDYLEGHPYDKQWGVKSMGQVANHLLEVTNKIIDDPTLFLSAKYLMDIYLQFLDEPPPFKKYWRNLFGK